MWSSSGSRLQRVRTFGPMLLCGVLLLLIATPVDAHESRQVGNYTVEVGLLGEPVYVGQRSGLDLIVTRDGNAVAGLDRTLKAEVRYGTSTMTLAIEPKGEGETGYAATFIPTAAGAYTFHLTGTIDGTPLDESFTSSPTGFDEVRETSSGQFPVVLPTLAELAAQSKQGADAAGLVPIAVGVGAAGIVVALLGLGIGLAALRRGRAGS
jgi:hypothetical protein